VFGLDDTEINNDDDREAVLENKVDVPVIYDLDDILQNNALGENDNNSTELLKEEAILLVGYKNFNSVFDLYKELEKVIIF
jgi:hypothetical protein